MQGQFAASAMHTLQQGESKGNYYAPRFARQGNETLGKPFPLFKQPAHYFTDYTPAGQSNAAYSLQRNLPTNTILANNIMQADGVSQATEQNVAMVNRTQTLANNGVPIACRNNADCEPWPGSTCNPSHMDWDISKGNQTNYCSYTVYPELNTQNELQGIRNRTYNRKNSDQGGIGKSCVHNGDCGQGYFCNNETNLFGKNKQQTGFCSQVYTCPDGSKQVAGYPYNSGKPVPPPKNQNNNGRGYNTKDECLDNITGFQNCIQDDNNKWFAVFSEFCPVPTNLRKNSQPQGAFKTSNNQSSIIMPGYATNGPSKISSVPQAFQSWNINSEASKFNNDDSPLNYSLSINPRPN